MAEPEIRSALHGVGDPAGLALRIWEMPSRGMIDLRGNAGNEAFRAGVKQVTGVDLPLAPRTSAAWGEIKILWLSIRTNGSSFVAALASRGIDRHAGQCVEGPACRHYRCERHACGHSP